jgi:hypothetical protein
MRKILCSLGSPPFFKVVRPDPARARTKLHEFELAIGDRRVNPGAMDSRTLCRLLYGQNRVFYAFHQIPPSSPLA